MCACVCVSVCVVIVIQGFAEFLQHELFNKSAHAQRSALVISGSHRRLQVVCVEK